MKKKKIAHFGAFDHDSYGDCLLANVADYFLSDSFDLTPVSPTSISPPWPDSKSLISVKEALRRDDWDGVLIGGGDIIQTGEWSTDKWFRTDELTCLSALPSLWIGAAFLAARLNIPLAWNCPGVPSSIIPGFRRIVEFALEASDYISVRDDASKAILDDVTNKRVHIVPDSAILISNIWPQKIIRNSSNYLACSISKFDLDNKREEIFSTLLSLAHISNSPKVKVLPLMAWQMNSKLPQDFGYKNHGMLEITFLSQENGLEEISKAISNSYGYVGNSLHGFITAISYGVPAVIIVPGDAPTAHKYRGFVESIRLKPELYLSTSWTEAIVLLRSQEPSVYIDGLRHAQVAHWERIRETLRNPSTSKQKVWQEIIQLSAKEATEIIKFGISPALLTKSYFDRLQKASKEIQQVYEQLQHTQAELQGTQAELQQTQAELQQTQAELQQTQAELQQTQAELQQT